MKLVAVYNVFDGEELLRGSIERIRTYVDEVIAVVQTESYNGIQYMGGLNTCQKLSTQGLIDKVFLYNTNDEYSKRQYCLDIALMHEATHYIGLDCDEYYNPEEFKRAKEQALKLNGSYCKIRTYFGTKNLTIGLDNYYVPFIHKIEKGDKVSKKYPVIVDPTRRLKGDAKELDCIMHHYSWVRDNIELKVNTSSSKQLIIKNGILEDYYKAKEGHYVKHYGKKLEKVNEQV